MAVLPTFDPENASYARSANGYIAGLDAGTSLMERKQAMDLREQQAAQQRAEFQAKLPLIQAEATKAIVSAKSAVDTATQQSLLETKAAAESPEFLKEYQDAMQLADWNARSDALAALQPKLSYMVSWPGSPYKGFVDTVNNSRVEAHNSAITDAKLEESLSIADDNRAARMETAGLMADSRTRVAEANAGARVEAASIYGQTRENVAQTGAQARRDLAKATADKNYEFERTKELRDQALTDGDREAAQLYQDRLNKMNTSAMSTADQQRALPAKAPPKKAAPASSEPVGVSISIPGSDLPPSGDAAPTPEPATPAQPAVAPTSIPKTAKSVAFGGKTYPVYFDKDHNAAYLIDGHYVPIRVE